MMLLMVFGTTAALTTTTTSYKEVVYKEIKAKLDAKEITLEQAQELWLERTKDVTVIYNVDAGSKYIIKFY